MASASVTIDQILHDLFYVGISAASIFLKNPASMAKAQSIASLLGNVLLPITDSLLNPPVAAAVAVPVMAQAASI